MRPTRIPTNETLRFIERFLPRRPATILDVGCGKGEVAAELHALGFTVTAIDVEPESVLLTRARGVNTKQVDFVKYDLEAVPFDVVYFGRSLHHIHPLTSAVERAHALLKPGGVLVAEELDLAAMNGVTAMWHYDTLALLEATGVLPRDPDEDAKKPHAPLERWRASHAHEPPLHDGAAIIAAIEIQDRGEANGAVPLSRGVRAHRRERAQPARVERAPRARETRHRTRPTRRDGAAHRRETKLTNPH
jgi:SAM-dependent methyltransferase